MSMLVNPFSEVILLFRVLDSGKKIVEIVDDVICKDVLFNLCVDSIITLISYRYGWIYITLNLIVIYFFKFHIFGLV